MYLEAFSAQLQLDDITSRSMGSAGDDLILSPAAQQVIPFDHEIKNVEAINIWAALEQAAKRVRPGRIPLVAFRRNKTRMRAALPMADLMVLVQKAYHYDNP
jgi:hypothetical protein